MAASLIASPTIQTMMITPSFVPASTDFGKTQGKGRKRALISGQTDKNIYAKTAKSGTLSIVNCANCKQIRGACNALKVWHAFDLLSVGFL